MNDKLITVNLTSLPSPVVKYSVIRDRSADEIESYAKANPGVLVFVFATGLIENCPDYSGLEPPTKPDDFAPEWKIRVVSPSYVGNFKEPEAVIRLVINQWLFGTIKTLVDDLF